MQYWVRQEGARRGFRVEVASAGLRWGGVVLEGVTVRHPNLPTLRADLLQLEVNLGLGGVAGISLRGGQIEYAGDLGALRDTLRGGTQRASAPAATTSHRAFDVSELDVAWKLPAAGGQLALSGVRLLREGDSIQGAVAMARGEGAGLRASLANVAVSFDSARRQLRSVDVDHAALELEPAELLKGLGGAEEPAAVQGTASPDDETGTTKPSGLWAKFGVLDATRPQRWRSWLAELGAEIDERIPDDASWSLDEVSTVVRFDAENALQFGPARVSLSKSGSRLGVDLAPNSAARGAKRVEMKLTFPLVTSGDLAFEIRGGPVSLSSLGIKSGDMGISSPERAIVALDLDVRWPLASDTLRVESNGELRELSLSHRRLAEYPLEGLNVAWRGGGDVHLSGADLRIEPSTMRLGAVEVQVEGRVERETERLHLRGKAQIPSGSCQEMFDSMPTGLAPGLDGARLSGAFSWHGEVDVDTDAPRDMRVVWRMRNGCRFEHVPPEVDPKRFRRRFVLSVPDELGHLMTVSSGPGSRTWVPLHDISRYLETAVLVTEDGRFWAHAGFDERAIESAIRQNVASGTFVRGASTISMQLAKNLYLSRSKLVARKVEEALLTMLLEQELRKDEILELYLNVIEYGPGIYGVQPAAEYYFRSLPDELSVAQSFFLASILPAPSRQRFTDEGVLTARWTKYIRTLLRIAHKRHRLDDAELDRGLAEVLRFGQPYQPPPPRRLLEDEGETF